MEKSYTHLSLEDRAVIQAQLEQGSAPSSDRHQFAASSLYHHAGDQAQRLDQSASTAWAWPSASGGRLSLRCRTAPCTHESVRAACDAPAAARLNTVESRQGLSQDGALA